jgi:hypothetical protein
LGDIYGVNGKKLQRQYRDYLSDFKEWKQLSHAKDWLIFPENIGKRLSIDEVALSQGELYTIITNKKAKGRAGSIVAIIKGTISTEVIKRVKKIVIIRGLLNTFTTIYQFNVPIYFAGSLFIFSHLS